MICNKHLFSITAAILVLLPLASNARVYTWIGSNGENWDSPSNWRPPDGTVIPNDATYPSKDMDTAVFDANSASDCKLTDDISLQSIECRAGFTKSINLHGNTLSITGDADFSNGSVQMNRGLLAFTGPENTRQVFTPKAGMEFSNVQMAGLGTLQISGSPLKVRNLVITSGTLQWSATNDSITRSIVVNGSASMTFDDGIKIFISGKTADFQKLQTMSMGKDDTLVFCAPADTQNFMPKPGVQFPHIQKVNNGTVRLSAYPLKAKTLTVSGGTWDWNGMGPNTVSSIITTGGFSTMIFNGATVMITEGDVDLRGLASIDGIMATLNFAGKDAQYFTAGPAGSDPLIKHTGKGALLYGMRAQESAGNQFRQDAKGSFIMVPDKYVIRETTISFELGMNIFPISPPMYYLDTINTLGITMGFLAPMRFPWIASWLHAKVLYHGSKRYGKTNRSYITGTNEMLIGKSFYVKMLPFEYTPLVGAGFNNGIILADMWGKGFKGTETQYYFHYNIGLMVREKYRYKNLNLAQGLMVNWEGGFRAENTVRQRINVSLIFSY